LFVIISIVIIFIIIITIHSDVFSISVTPHLIYSHN